MSRSNPTANSPHPCTRWHEWHGEQGLVRHYDKEAKANVDHKLPFTFLLLDRTATIKGWHDASDSGIHSNEVRDTTREPFVVKAFKGGPIAKGFYLGIKDRVKAAGGYYAANCYIAYRGEDKKLAIGSIIFKGAALNAWLDFEKANRKAIYEGAVQITGYKEGKKGKIVFRTPEMKLINVTEETAKEAVALDKELQEYLKQYFKKPTDQQAEGQQQHEEEYQEGGDEPPAEEEAAAEEPAADDIPW